MVEGTGLENRHTGEPGIESSNLSLSVLCDPRSSVEAQLSQQALVARIVILAALQLSGRAKDVGTGGRVV